MNLNEIKAWMKGWANIVDNCQLEHDHQTNSSRAIETIIELIKCVEGAREMAEIIIDRDPVDSRRNFNALKKAQQWLLKWGDK